jgi:hypothetical protein
VVRRNDYALERHTADPTAITMLPDDIARATVAIIAIDFFLG